MIIPPLSGGMSFTEAADGDMRNDRDARRRLSHECRIPQQWATVDQVHGAVVHRVERTGHGGKGDALWTTTADVPVVVFTADCVGVILQADNAIGVAHAGWKGVVARVIAELRNEMEDSGYPPIRAAISPGIGPCCFEVGPEVAERFPQDVTETTWGTVSVDLKSAIQRQLEGIDTWSAAECTRHDQGWFSHRRDATRSRLSTIGWI